MTSRVAITAVRRTAEGTRASVKLRQAGLLPGVLYGGPEGLRIPISTPKSAVASASHHRGYAFLNSLISLKLDDKTFTVIPRHLQHNPLAPADPLSVNFLVYDADKGAKVSVPLEILDEDKCTALKRGGIVNVLAWRVLVQVQGEHIPDSIPVSLAGLKVGDVVAWSNLKLPERLKACMTPVKGPGVLLLNILGSKSKGGKDDEDEAAASDAAPTTKAAE